MICRWLKRLFGLGPKRRLKRRLKVQRISTHKIPGASPGQQTLANLVSATIENEDSAKVDLNQKEEKR